jgi:hypothetical protein
MPSIGECDLIVNSQVVGTIRGLYIFADSAVYPRLGIQLSISLRDVPESELSFGKSLVGYELRDITGEIRLSENADVLGALSWAGPRRYVRSSASGFESQVKCVCDLDPFRIELVERRRNGAPPKFYVELWPVLVRGSEFLDAHVTSFELRVPREGWLEFLARAGGHDYEIIEVQYGPMEREHFQRALQRTREARGKLAAGDYDEAVGLCRKALEALSHEIPVLDSENPLKSLFVRGTDEKRGAEYTGIVSKLKQLAAFAHHDFGSPLTYSRAEAQFIIRTTEGVLSLTSVLAHNA